MLVYYLKVDNPAYKRFKVDNAEYVALPYRFYHPQGMLLLSKMAGSTKHNCRADILELMGQNDLPLVEDPQLADTVRKLEKDGVFNTQEMVYFYMYTDKFNEVLQALDRYVYFELRFSDIPFVTLNSFDIMGEENGAFMCLGFGNATFETADSHNVLEIVTPDEILAFDVSIPITTPVTAYTNCLL